MQRDKFGNPVLPLPWLDRKRMGRRRKLVSSPPKRRPGGSKKPVKSRVHTLYFTQSITNGRLLNYLLLHTAHIRLLKMLCLGNKKPVKLRVQMLLSTTYGGGVKYVPPLPRYLHTSYNRAVFAVARSKVPGNTMEVSVVAAEASKSVKSRVHILYFTLSGLHMGGCANVPLLQSIIRLHANLAKHKCRKSRFSGQTRKTSIHTKFEVILKASKLGFVSKKIFLSQATFVITPLHHFYVNKLNALCRHCICPCWSGGFAHGPPKTIPN